MRESVTSAKKAWNEKVQGAVSGLAVSRGSRDAPGTVLLRQVVRWPGRSGLTLLSSEALVWAHVAVTVDGGWP